MADPVVVDAGPLVALINRGDQFHDWAIAQVRTFDAELVTCDAVIAEAFFLVRHNSVGVVTLLSYLEDGVVRPEFRLLEHVGAVSTLMRKYRDVPMSLADACLVRMTELYDRARVFTLDTDFKLYRRHSRLSIPLIIPAT